MAKKKGKKRRGNPAIGLKHKQKAIERNRRKMEHRRNQLLVCARRSPQENAFAEILGDGWVRQRELGMRFFDFYSEEHGVAIEADGREHRGAVAVSDAARDEATFRDNKVIVFRVKYGDFDRLRKVVSLLPKVGTLDLRRAIIHRVSHSHEWSVHRCEYPKIRLLARYIELLEVAEGSEFAEVTIGSIVEQICMDSFGVGAVTNRNQYIRWREMLPPSRRKRGGKSKAKQPASKIRVANPEPSSQLDAEFRSLVR